MISEGDVVDVVARLSSRRFAGLETLQLEVSDVAPAGHLAAIRASSAAAGTTAPLTIGNGATATAIP